MPHAVTASSGARSIAAAAAASTPAATSSSGKTTSDAATNPTPGGAMGKEQFLKLLVAQMKNQDPLNPMDGTQMASQLAQFSTVEQLQNANDTLTQIAAAVRVANGTAGGSTSGTATGAGSGVANGGTSASATTGA